MKRLRPKTAILLLALASTTLGAGIVWAFHPDEPDQRVQDQPIDPAYLDAITRTAQMVGNAEARRLARSHQLNILNVTWEDTGRFKNSAVGPNISDMTIQVQHPSHADPSRLALTCMPVIRFPNFADKSGDIEPGKFNLLVGNHYGGKPYAISLEQLLKHPREYLHDPSSWAGDIDTLWAERDSHVLVSAQACFLPIPEQGEARFNPVLFNYQSSKNNPAVLTILATREGTSMTIIDNTRDGFEAGATWGQRLFFNSNGQRASLTGQRMSDFIAGKPGPDGQRPDPQLELPEAERDGLNMVLLIQVPLKHKALRRGDFLFEDGAGNVLPSAPEAESDRRNESNVEQAVIGHGELEGPFTEIDGQTIERDPRFPVRVTVQFYKATSNGVVNEKDMAELAAQIQRVYADADYVGSLVTEGETGRPTEHDGPKHAYPGWWDGFWQRHQQNTGQTREEAIRMLRGLLGPNWQAPEDEAKLRDQLERARRRAWG